MKIWTCRSSPRSGSRNAWTRIKNVNGASRLSNFCNFFIAIQMISCRDWWPWTKSGYITMTRKQSNNQWSGGIVAHPAPKNSGSKNPLEKFSHRFFGIKSASPSLIIFQRVKLSTRSIIHLCWYNWRTFCRKNAAGRSPRGSCSSTKMPRLTGHLQPRRNWPTWSSSVLVTHPILRIWPRRTTTVPWTEKKNKISPFFIRRRGHCCHGELDRRTNFRIFLSCLLTYSNGLRSLLSFVWSALNKSRVWSPWFVSFLVGLMTYQHPIV